MEKYKEYDSFKLGGNLYKANMDTLISDKDRIRFMDQQPEYKEMIDNFQFQDPLIKLNYNLPGIYMRPVEEKYNIKRSEIMPQMSEKQYKNN